jgi:hypothetical protein
MIGFALILAALIGSTVILGAAIVGVLIPAVLSRPVAMLPVLNADVRMLSTQSSLRATQSVGLLLFYEF